MTPLLIFEPRYRVLFSTLLAGLPDIEDGLVVRDSPFAGTRRFGMVYSSGSGGGGMASIGTTLEIEAHTLEPDGRILVVSRGLERFKITRVVTERPVLVCEVDVLPEDCDDGPEACSLAEAVAEAFRGVLRLHRKMRRGRVGGLGSGGEVGGLGLGSLEPEDEPEEAAELTEYNPWKLSYWVASVLGEHPPTQQALMEEGSTLARLRKEAEVLQSTLRYYSATAALEGAFSADAAGSAQTPPPGGPD